MPVVEATFEEVTNAGYVRIYQWTGTSWRQLSAGINGGSDSDFFGTSVSLSSDGSRLAVGAISYGYRNGAGIVRTYRWSGSVWEQLGFDIEGEYDGDRSGGSISLSSAGNRLVIGAPYNNANGERSGQVRLFQWTGSDWSQLGSDIDSDSPYDYFGKNVSLSSDGNRVVSSTGEANAITDSPHRVRVYDFSMFNTFSMNAGLNDSWYDPETNGQGFFITVFPDLGVVSLAWFTYDTELPPPDAVANLGDPGHRWFTANGPIDGDQAEMVIEMTSGGLFDTVSEITLTDPPGSDGTILLIFDGCESGTVEYDITSIDQQGIVPIQRVADDNVVICEALGAN